MQTVMFDELKHQTWSIQWDLMGVKMQIMRSEVYCKTCFFHGIWAIVGIKGDWNQTNMDLVANNYQLLWAHPDVWPWCPGWWSSTCFIGINGGTYGALPLWQGCHIEITYIYKICRCRRNLIQICYRCCASVSNATAQTIYEWFQVPRNPSSKHGSGSLRII